MNKTKSCWIWTGARQSKNGVPQYGNLKVGKKWAAAHRVAWTLERGPIGAGLWVLHKCDNPACVRPDHLFLGTVLDNNRDMWEKGRGVSNLPPHGNAKLTHRQVRKIRRLYEKGFTQAKIAEMFDTQQANISRIVRRTAFRHVA